MKESLADAYPSPRTAKSFKVTVQKNGLSYIELKFFIEGLKLLLLYKLMNSLFSGSRKILKKHTFLNQFVRDCGRKQERKRESV